MRVSVVIPVRDGERYLADAISSVLAQTLEPLETVVVDDGSTDGSARIAARFAPRVRCVRQDNRGPASARNLGIECTRGELLAFLDADDYWPADKLAVQCGQLEAAPDLDVVLGHTRFVREDGDAPGPTFPQFFLGSALVRRTAFRRAGPFDEALRSCEDWDWFLRAHELGIPMRMFAETTLCYRRHGTNLTRGPASRPYLLRMIRKHLARRRQHGTDAPALPEWFAAAARRFA